MQQKNRKLLNFRKANHWTENSVNSGRKDKWNGNFPQEISESFGNPFGVVLFFWKFRKTVFQLFRSSLWLNTMHFGIRSDEFENSYPCYKLFLNPDYVATRSLRSLHSNKSENSSLKELRSALFIWKS